VVLAAVSDLEYIVYCQRFLSGGPEAPSIADAGECTVDLLADKIRILIGVHRQTDVSRLASGLHSLLHAWNVNLVVANSVLGLLG